MERAILVNGFRSQRPDAFSNLSNFDILAKMQHYGLPTRLLDFTLNPLVALYFACESKLSLDGRVLCHGTFLMNDSSSFIKSISDVAVNREVDESYTIDDYICNKDLSAKKYLATVYLHPNTIVVRPKYWNQRITNQAGVFMIFPNNHYDKYMKFLIKAGQVGVERAFKEYAYCSIENVLIEKMMKYEPVELYSKEYKDFITDNVYREMVNSYRGRKAEEEFWNNIGKRICMSKDIKTLNQKKIEEQFCSIIIKSEDKTKIIKSLSKIGISEDYIYPELEYTAKEIRRQYEQNELARDAALMGT